MDLFSYLLYTCSTPTHSNKDRKTRFQTYPNLNCHAHISLLIMDIKRHQFGYVKLEIQSQFAVILETAPLKVLQQKEMNSSRSC